MTHLPDFELPEVFRWQPKWWWDPIPPWFADDLVARIGPELTKIQLEKRARVLEAELDAVRQTAKLLG